MTPTRTRIAGLLLIGALLAGCTEGVDTTYGRTRGASVNGTGALAEMFRAKGHFVRASSRLSDAARVRADVLVRFATRPGPPSREEATWYQTWLEDDTNRKLIFVPRDFDSEAEYWTSILEAMPPETKAATRKDVQIQLNSVKTWETQIGPPATDPADPVDWFEVDLSKKTPVTCATLSGPWAEGIDARAAGVTIHERLVEDGQTPLLKGDGSPLVYQWHWPGSPPPRGGASTLVVANGSFLLNEPLAHRARRPLAARVVDWLGESPRRVLFLEGLNLSHQKSENNSPFALFRVAPLGLIFGHWVAVLVLLALSHAVILGRPRSAPSAGADRPVAHAEALGNLLARTRDAQAARTLLETYRRWRSPSGSSGLPRDPRP